MGSLTWKQIWKRFEPVINLANEVRLMLTKGETAFRRRKLFDLLRSRRQSWTNAIVDWPPKGRTKLRWWKVN
ncbi:MAG: hypothetical protein ACTS4T_01265 [Candidatus Hodgkinia cicadicola]